jgi:hypothetical protein
MSNKPFYVFLIDEDKNTFNIEGPMTDDTVWLEKGANAQNKGRNVRWQTGIRVEGIERAASQFAAKSNYTRVSGSVF